MNTLLYYYFNPRCLHDKCSHTIMNCDECIAHSAWIQQERERQSKKPENELPAQS